MLQAATVLVAMASRKIVATKIIKKVANLVKCSMSKVMWFYKLFFFEVNFRSRQRKKFDNGLPKIFSINLLCNCYSSLLSVV